MIFISSPFSCGSTLAAAQRRALPAGASMTSRFASTFSSVVPRADSPSPNRWLIAAASCLMQGALGSVYAASVFLPAIMEQYGADRREANLAFTIAILALGITAGFGGALQRRYGPRAIATAGAVLYGLGTALAGCAPNLPLLYLTQGVIAGVGLGLGYIVPLAMLVRWFPDHRGFIAGLAVTGFGAGAMIVGPVAAAMLPALGLKHTLLALGAGYLVIGGGAAQFFRAAPEAYAPRGWAPGALAHSAASHADLSLAAALRSPRWYLLWLILALNVTAGAALISVASPLAQELTRVSATEAALAVMAISLCNGAGRILWGWASDRLGRPATFACLFALQFLAFTLLAQASNFATLLALGGIVGLCFGGGFAAMPAFTADYFGARHAGAIYGAMLTAWGAGAAAGPLLIASVDYRRALTIIAVLMLLSAPLALLAHRQALAGLARLLRPRFAAAASASGSN
jgi:MFS transporter, OFA family, oxalate/formate antiporter